ncbi:MAG: hypothetical protein NTY94_08825 [Alphaproteobacteria bacterium]|nr:hypothetical protein [Alphaproteobacteria bacterium]
MTAVLRLAGVLLLALAGAAHAQAPARPAAPRPAAADAPAATPVPEKPLALRMEGNITLRGPVGRWGTPVVDDLNRRIYLPRGPAGLSVLSLDGFKPVAEVPETTGSFAVALDPETLRGFSAGTADAAADGPAGAISVFDQRGFKPIPNVPEPVKALRVRHLLYDAATKQLAAATEEGVLTLIDPAKLAITGTIPLQGKRVTALATDRRGRLFATRADQDAVAVVNLVSREVATIWRPEGCRQPVAMVFDSIGMRLIVACRGSRAEGARPDAEPARESAVVIDPLGGRVLGRLPIPAGTETLIHDPIQRLVYAVSAAASAVMVFRQPDAYRYEALETAGTRPLAGFGVADGRTGRLLLATAEYVVVAPQPDGTGGGLRLLPNSYTLLSMKRLPLE